MSKTMKQKRRRSRPTLLAANGALLFAAMGCAILQAVRILLPTQWSLMEADPLWDALHSALLIGLALPLCARIRPSAREKALRLGSPTIARAVLADPRILILDEATSSIDTRTEAIVQRGMDKLMEGRTVFVIAHRLSTVRNSDVIMVLDHGRIIERGNHQKLIEEKGTYYQLYTGAFELE